MKNKLLLAINTSLVLFLPLSLTSCGDSQSTLQTYSISFYDNDTLISEISTSGYEIITLPEAPIKDNYTFKGWYLDKNTWSEKLSEDYFINKALTHDINSYAYYEENVIPEPQEYTINFYVDDEIFSTLQTSGNELIALPQAPKKESYEFVGWFFDKDTFNNQLKEDTYLNKSLDQDINVYANYLFKEEPAKEFTVTFETCGGDKMDSITTSIISSEPIPTRYGYTFLGWYLENTYINKVTFPYEVTQNITLYAKWEKNTYHVHFELYGGEGVSDLNVSVINEEPIPTRKGYTFLGWYFESDFINKVTFPYEVTQNITLYAKWEKNTYNVHFELNGGKGVSDLKVSVINEEPIPTREGYTFLGWYFENNFINKVTFPYEVTQNITLYAKWEKNLPTSISFVVSAEGVLTEVNGISETNNVVIIPNEVNNIEIKEIGEELFLKNTYIEKLVIPETVTTLGYKMCYGCTNLKEVTLPDNISVIPDYAFEKCTLLEKINIPQSLVQIRNDAFAESGIKEFVAPDSFKEIWGYAFKDCKNLEKVDLNKTTSIGDMSFENCTKLSSIVLPNTLVELGTYVFSGCTLLNNIKMPSNPIEITNTFIYGSGYYNDTNNWENGILYVDNYLITTNNDLLNQQSINVKEGTIVIAINAFTNNGKKLKSIVLPEGLKIIGSSAFSSLYSLSQINIPSSVISIGNNAFGATDLYENQSNWENGGFYIDNWLLAVDNVKMTEFSVKEGTVGVSDGKSDTSLFPTKATSISSLTLPSTLKYIGNRSFARLKITSLELPETLETMKEGAFMNCAFLESVNLEDCKNLKSIGNQAFSNCAIKEITIPSNVLEMGELIFNHNSVDLLVHCQFSEKPEGWNNNWDYTYSTKAKITVEWN